MTKAILFDFDGTLADTSKGILNTLRETLIRMGAPVPDDRSMRETIGLPLVKALKMLGDFSDEKAIDATTIYRSIFEEYEVPSIVLFPGVADTLRELAARGIRMGIVTSRDGRSLRMILDRHGIADIFEDAVTNSDHLTPKPAPDMVLALIDRMGLSKDETLVVGDTTFDIDMGNSAGCRTCAASYGNHTREQLLGSNPSWMINNFEEILKILQ